MTDHKERTKSDRPIGELRKECDAFFQGFFQKGAQLTEELLSENARLRSVVANLEAHNAELRAQLASDDAIRELLRTIDALEREKNAIVSRYKAVEEASSHWGDKYHEVEMELADLANLYVASNQLHGSLRVASTLARIGELLEQFIGARVYALYFRAADGGALVPVLAHGFEAAGPLRIAADAGLVSEIYLTGVARIQQGPLDGGALDNPVALVPMKVEDEVVGVLAIYSTLEQKSHFLPVDFELMKLLGTHAGAAILCARLFAAAGNVVSGFDGMGRASS